jgi:ATP-dependent Clp protease, protease subunit
MKPDSRMPANDKLLKHRIVLLSTVISDQEATQVIAKLLFLEMQSTDAPITLRINSPGGSATAGLAIIKTVESLRPKVQTHCIGEAHSIAAIILAAGTRGLRSAEINTIISFSPVLLASPPTTETQMYLNRLEGTLIGTTARLTGMTTDQTTVLFNSRKNLNPAEARDLGIIDQICYPGLT